MIAAIVLALELARVGLIVAARAALAAGDAAHALATDAEEVPARRAAYEAALAAYDRAAQCPVGFPERTRARFDAGVVLAVGLDRPAVALARFEALLASDTLDVPIPGKPGRNERHHAWRMVSVCQLALGRHAAALDAAFAMRDAFVPRCSCCHAGLARLMRRQVYEIGRAWLGTTERPADDLALRAVADELPLEPADEVLWALGRFAAQRRLAARGPLSHLRDRYPTSRRTAAAGELLATIPAE